MSSWGIKYHRGELVTLKKCGGEAVTVRIEGVSCSKSGGTIYDVREIDTGEGYPAMQDSLKKIPRNAKIAVDRVGSAR